MTQSNWAHGLLSVHSLWKHIETLISTCISNVNCVFLFFNVKLDFCSLNMGKGKIVLRHSVYFKHREQEHLFYSRFTSLKMFCKFFSGFICVSTTYSLSNFIKIFKLPSLSKGFLYWRLLSKHRKYLFVLYPLDKLILIICPVRIITLFVSKHLIYV